MKIVIAGFGHSDWHCEKKCDYCGAVLAIERTDVFLSRMRDSDYWHNEIRCICISCGKQLLIDHDDTMNGYEDDRLVEEIWGCLPTNAEWEETHTHQPERT